MKKVSIIIPSYNIEQYISKCLESVVSQTYKDLEIIIVNDGSKDNTQQIAERFVEKDARIILLNKKNGGLSDARNYGLNKATGEYILFIDGDDYIKENMVEVLVEKIEGNDIISFNYMTVTDDKITNVSVKNRSKDNVINYILGQPSACTKMYKKSFLIDNNIKFDKGILYEDLALMPALACLTDKIKIIDDCLYYYVIRQNSIMHNKKFSEKKTISLLL